jgi:hypothetical protein
MLAADGPRSWARVHGPDPNPPVTDVEPAVVSRIRNGDDRISFDVDRPGTPVLVKASYFPNWKAAGARGPWRVTPNLMVVIPTQRHVTLHYGWTPVDVGGILLTLTGIALVLVLVARRPVDFHDPEPEAEVQVPEQLTLEMAIAPPPRVTVADRGG